MNIGWLGQVTQIPINSRYIIVSCAELIDLLGTEIQIQQNKIYFPPKDIEYNLGEKIKMHLHLEILIQVQAWDFA